MEKWVYVARAMLEWLTPFLLSIFVTSHIDKVSYLIRYFSCGSTPSSKTLSRSTQHSNTFICRACYTRLTSMGLVHADLQQAELP